MSTHLAAAMKASLRVLVVEDDARFRAMLAAMLRELGCEPVPAASAIEALRSLDDREPDVVLLDLHMPPMDGMSFLARFRRRHADAPVIILTGAGTLEAAQEAMRLRATDFLTKPCHLGSIEAALDRARRELARTRDREASPPPAAPADPPATATARPLAEIEREAIHAALSRHAGNRSAAARELGISRRTLHYRLAEYGRTGP